MKIGRGVAVQRHLGQLFEGQSVAGLGESQLLDRFVERRDESAFAALVARHGPMVVGVCSRLLADPHDVEDAYQATFLVLARKAGSLQARDRLAPWLFGVARRVATRARADLARRKAREVPGVVELLASQPGLDAQGRELGRALIEEIDRLPGSLRESILLCCVEGLSYEEAASELRSTAPAVRGRLARARECLRGRLTRRGFAPGLGGFGILLAAETISAAVPSQWLSSTIQAAKGGTVPLGVEILAEGVIRTMFLTKSKIVAAALVAFGVAGSSVGLNAQDAPPVEPPARRPSVEVDRLDQVEKKLDRVLQALEGKSDRRPSSTSSDVDVAIARPAFAARPDAPPMPPPLPAAPAAPTAPVSPPAPVTPFVATPDLPSPARRADAPPRPVAPPSLVSPPVTLAPFVATPVLPTPARRADSLPRAVAPPLTRSTTTRSSNNSTGSDRLDALEQKLERLEARLARVEKAIGREVGADVDPGTNRPISPPRNRTRVPNSDRGSIDESVETEAVSASDSAETATVNSSDTVAPVPTPR